MPFSAGEKLIISMLCDLYKPTSEREIDHDFVQDAINGSHEWALSWEYPGIYHNDEISTPDSVYEVCDILAMWSEIESVYDRLDEAEKSTLAERAKHFGKYPQFQGFDGNQEGEQLHTVRVLIKMDRWTEFAGRDLNSHMPMLDHYRSMLIEYKKRRDPKLVTAKLITVEDIVAILNAGY